MGGERKDTDDVSGAARPAAELGRDPETDEALLATTVAPAGSDGDGDDEQPRDGEGPVGDAEERAMRRALDEPAAHIEKAVGLPVEGRAAMRAGIDVGDHAFAAAQHEDAEASGILAEPEALAAAFGNLVETAEKATACLPRHASSQAGVSPIAQIKRQCCSLTGTTEPITKRHMRNAWYLPFCRRLDIEYPSGLRHIIFNSATPIDDGSIQLVQILFRNDREEDCSTQELIDWDAVQVLGREQSFTKDTRTLGNARMMS